MTQNVPVCRVYILFSQVKAASQRRRGGSSACRGRDGRVLVLLVGATWAIEWHVIVFTVESGVIILSRLIL